VIQLIREKDVLKSFPKNTEGDLYIWLVARRETLEKEKETVGRILTEKIIEDLQKEISTSPIWAHLFGQKLDLQSVLP
jgi:hypothetical protein